MLSRVIKTFYRNVHMSKLNFNLTMWNQTSVEIFQKGVAAVSPPTLIRNTIRVENGHLVVRGVQFPISKPLHLVGFGKAVLSMAIEIENILGANLKMGMLVVPEGIFQDFPLQGKHSKLQFFEGGKDNLPDYKAMRGATAIKKLVQNLGEGDLLLVLISGGGSALSPLPKPHITIEEQQSVIKFLSKRGADIREMNTIRKKTSELSGGGLAEMAYPAKIVALILSDIVGDPIDFIASGPTTPNSDSPDLALKIMKKYFAAYERVPPSVRLVVEDLKENTSPLVEGGQYKHVTNVVIGDNVIAAEAAAKHAQSLGFQSIVLTTTITIAVTRLAHIYADLTLHLDNMMKDSSHEEDFLFFLNVIQPTIDLSDNVIEELLSLDFTKKICLIGAGEPNIIVKGNGVGGRNQQLALEYGYEVGKFKVNEADFYFLSCGTDGIDGPTDAAGAIVTQDLQTQSVQQKLNMKEFIEENNAYEFFSEYAKGANLIKTGHTGTNVMDLHVLLVVPKEKTEKTK